MSWDIPFLYPIPIAGAGPLLTLRDAAMMIQKLPKADITQPRWQMAMHVMLQAADQSGPTELARLEIMQALRPNGEPVTHAGRNDPNSNGRKLARDR